jgi:hypothetical protein
MNWQSIRNKIDPVYLVFAGVGFISIAIFISLRTALFVLCFLATTALFSSFLVSIYTLITNRERVRKLTGLIVITSLVILSSIVLYFSFGTYALLRSLSVGLVLVIVVLGYTLFTKRLRIK